MARFIILQVLSALHVWSAVNGAEHSTGKPWRNETSHIFLLMVPDSYVQRQQLLRQDEEDVGTGFAETSQFIGQILQGVLGGDLRPIFAGSVKFVEDPTAQQGVGTLLGSIAPALNVALREVYTRAQVALGFRTTPKPVSPTPIVFEYEEDFPNSTMTSITQLGNETLTNSTSNATLTLQLEQQKQEPVQQLILPLPPQQPPPPPPAPTTSWEYVLKQIYGSTTTPEPLPLIKRSTPSDNDYDYEDNVNFVY